MRIVFLAPFGIRPKGTVIARMLPLAVELQSIGHTVTIIAPPYTNPEDSGKTEVLRGVRLVNVTLPNGGKALGAIPLAWRMFRAMLSEQPDVAHLFKPKGYGGLAAMLLIALQHFGSRMPPLFVDTDDWEGEGGMNALHSYSYAEKRLFAFQEQWLSCNAAGVSVASRELERLTRDLGVTKEHIFYLPNGVEKSVPGDGLRIRKKLSIPNDAPVMLLYTRFFEFTQERVHRVFAEIFRRVPGVRFLIVGKGRHGEEERLRTAARENGFFEVLIMAGWVEPHELPDYLAAADVAIYPMDDTLVNRAKCPAKLTEIILAGIPVVADGVGQAREYIHDPDLLSNHLDESDMVDKVVAVLAGKSGTKLSGEAGRQHILERYNWHDIANGVSQFYSLFRGDKK